MSVRRGSEPNESHTALIFAGAAAVMCAIWFFGIATRVSLREDESTIAMAGISRVLDSGIGDFRDTFFMIAVATAAYLVCLWALRRGFRHSFAAAIGGTVLASLSMLPAMPLSSPDAVHLAADVRTFWIQHEWPAGDSGLPSKFDDPVANEVVAYRDEPSGYGPVAYVLGGAALPFVGDSFKANLLGQKIIGGIFLTLTAAAAGMLARRLGQNGAAVAGMVGLNPLMVWQYPGDGHNDAMMAFFGVVALGLVMEQGWKARGGGVATWAVSALCKYGLLLASPVVAAWWWPKWRNGLAALAGIGGALVLFLYILDMGPVQNGTVGPAGAVVRTTPWRLVQLLFDTGRSGDNRMVVTGYFLFLLILAAVMMYHRLETKEDLVRAVALVMGLFLYACSPGYIAWYQAWFLPFAAMSNSRWMVTAALAFSIGAFLPILALNWVFVLEQSWGLSNAIEWSVVAAWLGTALAAWVAWRGRRWATLGRAKAGQKTGPRFAPRRKSVRV